MKKLVPSNHHIFMSLQGSYLEAGKRFKLLRGIKTYVWQSSLLAEIDRVKASTQTYRQNNGYSEALSIGGKAGFFLSINGFGGMSLCSLSGLKPETWNLKPGTIFLKSDNLFLRNEGVMLTLVCSHSETLILAQHRAGRDLAFAGRSLGPLCIRDSGLQVQSLNPPL